MGVTQLWNILEPVKRQGDLASLKGKTLCVDLSGWICEAQGSKGLKANVLKPHLRNLFFRVWNLTRVGVKLVFVVDGDAPEVKWEAIAKRNEARHAYGGRGRGKGRGVVRGQRKKDGRSNFRIWVNECTTLLKLLGIPYVESAGEAEALCAWMNAKGIVDGCITNDGDAFLYGARTVYKDLCISNKECTMDSYCMDDVEAKMCLNREKLVSLAILLGCDYLPQGVPGVGKELGLKLVQALNGVNLLQRFQEWSNFETCEDDMSRIEKTVKQKASKVAGFPNQAVINEFMCPKLKTQHLIIPKDYECPDLKRLQEFCLNYLEWPEDYTTEKILPLVTYWQMEKGVSLKHNNKGNIVSPERIVKARVQNRIECYEVIWRNDAIGDACQTTFVTIETRSLFGQVYPVLVEEFEALQSEKKSKKSVKRKAKHSSEDLPNDKSIAVEELCSNFHTLSLAAESDSVREPTSHTKQNDGKQIPFSSNEIGEEDEAGNLPNDNENIQEKQNGKDPRQRHQEEDEQPCDRAKCAQKRNFVPEVQNGNKNSRNENLKVENEVENFLDSTDTSSEDEMSDSFFLEFVAPLARRLEEQCSKNTNSTEGYKIDRGGTNAEIDTPGCIDFVDTESVKKSNEKDKVDGGKPVVLIESSDEEHDVCHRLRHKEKTKQEGREGLLHGLERSTLENSSTRKYDAKTSQRVESDIRMTALERTNFCTRTIHKKHPSEKKADDALNRKGVKREPGIMPLGKKNVCSEVGYGSQMATGKMKGDGVRNAMEVKTKPINNSHYEQSTSSLTKNRGKSRKAIGSSIVSSSCVGRASVTMATQDQESLLRGDEKIRSNQKTKVMKGVYFSSDSSDDDDSWYLGSGNGGGGGCASTAADDAAADDGDDHSANVSWYNGCVNGGGVAASDGANDSWYLASGSCGVARSDDSWFIDGECADIAAAAAAFIDDHFDDCDGEDIEKTKLKNIKKQEKKANKMPSTKTTKTKPYCLDNDTVIQPDYLSHSKSSVTNHVQKGHQKPLKNEGKVSSGQFGETIPGPANNMIHKDNQTHQCMKKHQKLSKVKNSKASELMTNQTDFDNIRQVKNLHTSTHTQDEVCQSLGKNEKLFTPKSLEKSGGKENESPLEDVFVPLSLSERLGRHLHGNILSTLRTLSSN